MTKNLDIGAGPFDVFQKIVSNLSFADKKIGEIGCGYGLVQKQMEQHHGVIVDGFDLNANALRDSVAANHPRYCYNIFDCQPQFAARYDVLILFDVIEHIEQEKLFLDAVLFHLKPGGLLLINVPALMSFYSVYDKVVGHQRRYTYRTMEALCAGTGLEKIAATYWGLPLIPILWLRNLRVARQSDPQLVIRHGYKPPGYTANLCLQFLSSLEPLPQRLVGTSLMVIYRKESAQ